MKFTGLYFTILSTLCISSGVKGYDYNGYEYNNNVDNTYNNVDYSYNNDNSYEYNNINYNYDNTNYDNSNNNDDYSAFDFISTLDPVLRFADPLYDPFNLNYAAVSANATEKIAYYENLYNISKDECLRGCYSYCIHMLEISYNLECNSKFNSINAEYKKNKPCYKVNPDMQNILDHGNAYLDLFCSRGDDDKPCSFVSNIVKVQTNATLIDKTCQSDSKNRTTCDNSLINNLSIMVDASKKLKSNSTTYASGGNTISLSTPKYNLTLIEATMNNRTCLVEIKPPQEILVNADPKPKTSTNDQSSSAILTQNINTLFVLITITLVALLF